MGGASRLLVVEDDLGLREALVEQLAPSSRFDVEACGSAGEAREALKTNPIDLVLTEAGLPDMPGQEAVRLMRQDGFRGPVIMLVPGQAEADIPTGPDAVTETVVKPFRFSVLLARILANLRAHEASEEAALSIGPYLFRFGVKTLTAPDGEVLKLTEKEAAILRYLHRSGQATVGREVLLQEVWGYSAGVTTHTLETHIYRLRQKIETDPAMARILVTEPGGYRLLP